MNDTLMREALRTDREQIAATKQLASANRELARTIQRGLEGLAILLEGSLNHDPNLTVGDGTTIIRAVDALRKPTVKTKGGDGQ